MIPAHPLLLDVACLCDAHTNEALEYLHKAAGEDPPPDFAFDEHPNPFVRRIVNLFTQRGLDRIEGLRSELNRWLRGEMHQAVGLAPAERPPEAMLRWDQTQLGIVRLYLENLQPSLFTLDDWMLLVDYLAQRYLGVADLRSEADWLATRSALMGRVEAAMGPATISETDMVLATLPTTIEDAVAVLGLTPLQRAVIDFGRARCSENVTSLADEARHRLRKLIVDYQEAGFLGIRADVSEALQTKLLDAFGTMNRDWRRIAVTEATENANQGFIATQAFGAKVRRVEKYRGACAFCRAIDGKIMEVVDPASAEKDGATQVWVGKTNIGRSASPRKREGGELIEREPHEMWWCAAGAQHPHCRGSWVNVGGASDDPEFDAWLETLGRRGKP